MPGDSSKAAWHKINCMKKKQKNNTHSALLEPVKYILDIEAERFQREDIRTVLSFLGLC